MPETAIDEMLFTKNMFGKNSGRQYIHIVQSFDPKDNAGQGGKLTHEMANEIGLKLAEYFTGFQAVVATHFDTQIIHNHILLNSVNFESGLKFQQSKNDMQLVKDFSDRLCLEHGLSVIVKDEKTSADIKRGEYQAALKGESWKMALIVAIDKALSECRSREEFITQMNLMGYRVNWTNTRKHITYTTPQGKKCRDNKLHDKRYLKEMMESEFSKVEEYRVAEAEQLERYEKSGAVGVDKTARRDHSSTGNEVKKSGNDPKPTKNGTKQPLQADNPTIPDNNTSKKGGIKDILANAQIRADEHNAAQAVARANGVSGNKRINRGESR